MFFDLRELEQDLDRKLTDKETEAFLRYAAFVKQPKTKPEQATEHLLFH